MPVYILNLLSITIHAVKNLQEHFWFKALLKYMYSLFLSLVELHDLVHFA